MVHMISGSFRGSLSAASMPILRVEHDQRFYPCDDNDWIPWVQPSFAQSASLGSSLRKRRSRRFAVAAAAVVLVLAAVRAFHEGWGGGDSEVFHSKFEVVDIS